ncbi:uncharacterized protein [Drosophila kikkawai]|uniref:CCHC-type domain-containing protein n=1 Tax=Drosophila kikkawai TaxID=30033 RepID=A0ABM4G9G8_DROKI
MMRYQMVQPEDRQKTSGVVRPGAPLRQTPAARPTPAGGDVANVRCFNCRAMGHFSSQCKKPKRPEGACFHCFETGHQYRRCPKRVRTAALSACDGQDEKEGDDDVIGGNPYIQLIPEAP